MVEQFSLKWARDQERHRKSSFNWPDSQYARKKEPLVYIGRVNCQRCGRKGYASMRGKRVYIMHIIYKGKLTKSQSGLSPAEKLQVLHEQIKRNYEVCYFGRMNPEILVLRNFSRRGKCSSCGRTILGAPGQNCGFIEHRDRYELALWTYRKRYSMGLIKGRGNTFTRKQAASKGAETKD